MAETTTKPAGKASVSPCIRLAALLSIVGFILYIINSTTGFMAGRSVSALTILFSLIAICALVILTLRGATLKRFTYDLLQAIGAVALMVGLVSFVMERVSVFADIYFLPVNYPASEELTSNVSIAGFVIYILAIVALIIAAFQDQPKEPAPTVSIS